MSPVQLHVSNLVPAHPDIMVAAISAGEQSPDDDGCITVTRILTPPEGDALYDYEGHDLRLLFHLNRTEAAYLIAGVDATTKERRAALTKLIYTLVEREIVWPPVSTRRRAPWST